MVLIIVNGDIEDLNNCIEIAFYIAVIPAVLFGKSEVLPSLYLGLFNFEFE